MKMRFWQVATTVGLMILSLGSAVVAAAEIRLFGALAVQEVTADLLPKFERATGHKVLLTVDALPGLMKRLNAGETADVVLLPAQGIAALVKQGKAREADVRTIARSNVGVAVRKGTPRPDISSADAFKQSMLNAKSILISDPAHGGFVTPHLYKVFERLGIAEEMKRKAIFSKAPGTAGLAQTISATDVNIGLNQLQEFAPIAAMELVGPLPGDLGLSTPFSAVVMGTAGDVQAATALINFMRSPEAAAVIKATGLEAAFP